MQGRAKGVQIGTRVGVALVLFGWGIAGCTQGRCLFALGVASNIGARNAKVHQVRPLILLTDDDVGGFDITMHNGRRLLRQVLQHVEDLRSDIQRLAFLHWLTRAIQAIFQVFPFDIFLYHEVA